MSISKNGRLLFVPAFVALWLFVMLQLRDDGTARPFRMAPQAFAAYERACRRADVNIERIGQTIGDALDSVGYHRRDSVLKMAGENVEYCAAVDLAVAGLSEKQIARWCASLAREGFAPFYRHKGKWKHKRHIHAIYAKLRMKPQLRRQVREFLAQRRDDGLPRLS